MYNVWRTTVILIVTMYTEFVLYYTMLIVLNKFNSIQFNSFNSISGLITVACSNLNEESRVSRVPTPATHAPATHGVA